MSNDVDRQVQLLKTIADETRLRILGLLAAGSRTGRELAAELGLTPPTISHHMARLVEVGIVGVQVDGTRHHYTLTLDGVTTPEANLAQDPFQAKTVRTFFDGERLKQIPAKRKARVAVLLELLKRFEPGRRYSEPEVNAVLRTAHDDVATLRRELVDYRYLKRDFGYYSVTDEVPERDANEAQEVPEGEASWLAQLIRSTVPNVAG
ncbi:MAG: metalloregulator ArsR/SmtB family transcription factor [Propionibacteriaceae bacterium]|nr:metalloregulator ArsR/SmtB family transcription factor [Propionibacteriaceae bacterium]